MVLNKGREFKGKVIDLLNRWGVNRIQISVYHAPVNGIIKRGHEPLKDALSKLGDNWVTNLVIVLFADRIIVYGPIGYTLFYMIYG
jgi:CRISPR/Cas system-associated endoribonuclease Cas2